MHNRFRFTSLATVAALLSGCAGTHFTKEIPSALTSPVVAPQPDAGLGLIVSVHWPAGVDARVREAVDQRSQAYYRAAFGPMFDEPGWERVNVTGGLPIASTYYAAEAYMALRRALPAAHILLEPQMITLDDAGGNLAEKPMLNALLPVALRLDVSAPQGGKFPFVNEHFTFSIRTPAVLSGRNCGLFSASAAETPVEAIWVDDAQCVAGGAAFPHKPVWYLGATEIRSDEAFGRRGVATLPANPDQTLLFPLVWYVNAGVLGGGMPDYIQRSRPATPGEADAVIVNPYIENQSRIVASVAGLLAGGVSKPGHLAQYAGQFDPALGRKLAEGTPLTGSDAANVKLIEQLLGSELKVRVRRDHETARAVLAGGYGNAVRAIRDSSFKGFNSEMRVAWSSAIGMFGSAMATASPTQLLAVQQQGFNNLATDLDRSGQAFLKAVAPSLQKLDNAWLEHAGQRMAVDITDQSKLTAALKRLYDQHKR